MGVSRRSLLAGIASGVATAALGPVALAELRLRPAAGVIRLRSNENPYGPSRRALTAAVQASERGAYYPGPIKEDLLAAIASRLGVTPGHLALASGSNEALCAAAIAWGRDGGIVAPALTYDEHLEYAEKLGVGLETVPLRADMTTDLDGMLDAARRGAGLVYVCNPNNPTGLTIDGDELREFCRLAGKTSVVVVDEAYNELTDDPAYTSMLDLVRAEENVVVMRTFSKLFGLAGMRIGYGIAPPALAEVLRMHVMSWPNVVGIAAALESYRDEEFIRYSRSRILEGRRIVTDTFMNHGITPLPSQTNFVYADIGRDADRFAAQMAERNVLIRGAYRPYDTWTRVSMGRLEELEEFSRIFGEVWRTHSQAA